jgi:hypothetical protein
MVMFRDQNAGRSHNIKIEIRSLERVEQFKYLGTTFTYENSLREEITSGLKQGDASYHSEQDLLSSSLLSKNVNIKVYRNIILPFFLGVKHGR